MARLSAMSSIGLEQSMAVRLRRPRCFIKSEVDDPVPQPISSTRSQRATREELRIKRVTERLLRRSRALVVECSGLSYSGASRLYASRLVCSISRSNNTELCRAPSVFRSRPSFRQHDCIGRTPVISYFIGSEPMTYFLLSLIYCFCGMNDIENRSLV